MVERRSQKPDKKRPSLLKFSSFVLTYTNGPAEIYVGSKVAAQVDWSHLGSVGWPNCGKYSPGETTENLTDQLDVRVSM